MNIKFTNLPQELQNGAARICKKLGLEISDSGIEVNVCEGNNIEVCDNGTYVTIVYSQKIHFFRALGIFAENLKKGRGFSVTETPQFKTSGIMPDFSTDSMMKPEFVCDYMDYMAIMGLNMMLLYLEVNYELPSRKYFNYMTSNYTNEEMKAMDDYAFEYGIELIPCMQTLGHLNKYLRWAESADVKETERELNVDSDATYKFIEEMIVCSTSNLRSKRIHIGMDETWGLGRGRHSIQKYGLRDQERLYIDHLKKVVAITDKHGLTPMIWNDFLFCLHSESGINKYDEETEIPAEIMAEFPKNVQLVYWHYGEEVRGCDEFMIRKNQLFGNDVLFAGGAMMWSTALPDQMFSYDAAEEGLIASKKCGLSEVFTTLWFNGSKGCLFYPALLHLQQYAEHTYHKTVSMEHLKSRFEACTGASFDAFWNMGQFCNIMDGREKNFEDYNERYHGQKFLWQDVLIGLYDEMLYKTPISDHYKKWTAYYADMKEKNDKWCELYNMCYLIFDYLTLKTYVGENMRLRYLDGDMDFVIKCQKELLPELLAKTKTLHSAYRKMWYTTRKPFGFELIDNKFGGLEARTESAIERLEAYINGEIDTIEEFDEPRLPMPESLWT